jgi:DivIVA domain-containing protein
VHLSPDEIERRSFAIEDRGYDRDEVRVFLLEVASALRLALHTTRPPAATPPATAVPTPPPAAEVAAGGDDFARLGSEVAEVLRSAHEAVAGLHHQAEVEIAARHEEALAAADEVRRQAEADATWTHDRAKRVLITAQEQADSILAEADADAAELLASARRQAHEHADQVATRTRRHAEQILRAEREALRRLHQAQAGVAAAVEMLTGSETRPVVDLTELRPSVRLGPLSLEPPEPEPTPTAPAVVNDPVARMIRNAVDRASQHAQESGTIEPTDIDDVPRDQVSDIVDAAQEHEQGHESARGVGSTRAAARGTAATGTAVAAPPAPANPVTPVAPVRVVRSAPRSEPTSSPAVAASPTSTPHGSGSVAASGVPAPAHVEPSTAGAADDGHPRRAN